MLFFGTVAGVDDCKFKFNDDIEEQLLFDSSKKTAGQHEEDPYQGFFKYNPKAGKWSKSTSGKPDRTLKRARAPRDRSV